MPACDDLMDVSDVPDRAVLLAGEIAAIRAVLGEGIPEGDIVGALARCGSNPERAINALLDSRLKDSNGGDAAMALIKVKVEKPEVGGGALMPLGKVKVEEPEAADTKAGIRTSQEVELKKEQSDCSSRNDPSIAQGGIEKKALDDLYPMVALEDLYPMFAFHVKNEQPDDLPVRDQSTVPHDEVKKEQFASSFKKDDVLMGDAGISFVPRPKKRPRDDETVDLTTTHPAPYLNPRPIRAIPPSHAMSLMPPEPVRSFAPPEVTDRRLVLALPEAEVGEFPDEPDWFIAGKSYVTGLSTCRGRRLMDAGEIVHFNFPSGERRFGGINVKAKTGAALASIVRFSTKRSGEIGKLTPEWTRCLVPLVGSSKVKIQGRCVFPTVELRLMQEIVLYVSFYIHCSVFTEGNGSWNLIAPANIDNTVNPLLTLFNLLKIKPFKKADFTPEELNTRNLRDDEDEEESCHVVGLEKRRTGGQTYPEQSTDEQAISESSLNKIVGTAEIYDLEEAEPPSTLVSVLRPYQKQALFWMSEREKGTDVEQAAKTLHPCWNAYNVDKRASAVYVNVFSGEATTQFPSATQMARGGILADAMGLGKTVMTIALILSNPKGEWSDQQESYMEGMRNHKTRVHTSGSSMKGGTLIVCPMALLGQWKDELEAHSTPGALSVFVYYGGDKTDNLKVMTEHSVVLTTYGVLSSAYQPDSGGVFHKIDWYRVVLDEAHTIKSSNTKVAQAAFGLSSHCRWCLTGTPLQNNLEDLYSLLCFLHVEPWCNAAWWQKLIQKPYENGDERGLRLVKAILRPLMLRRTKETKDKMGNPILVLPPAHVEVVECEQSEAERDFYDALFRRSKVRFNQFVAQGKVLHNYASILELLLRLRQCCNHPFLVMSRGNTQQPADLDKLARRFLEGPRSDSGRQAALPTRAYVEEVVEGIRQGVVAECPICLESASDDPVLTPCAHRMCRECLLYSWRTPSGGPCPICRSPINKADLITCPSESRFQFDISNNWKESCKVRELLGLLESLQKKREKSIVFSQWTGFFDLLEIPLCNKKIQFLRFDGKLSQKQRERVLKEFSESHDKLVLLMSLKAGGVGLNLTAASNVFLMDPWWNPAVEEQAIMRIHRIGQKRTVHVRRFIVKDTVEERMQQVQARKQRMISGALTDEEVRTARIEELKMLFT